MSGLVLDNSVCMAWAFEDEADIYSDAVLEALTAASARVPALWIFEAANVLCQARKRRRLSAMDVRRFLELLQGLPLEVEPARAVGETATLADLAFTHGLSAYDAAYLDLAMRTGLPLATRDVQLKRAAVRAGVKLFAAA